MQQFFTAIAIFKLKCTL